MVCFTWPNYVAITFSIKVHTWDCWELCKLGKTVCCWWCAMWLQLNIIIIYILVKLSLSLIYDWHILIWGSVILAWPRPTIITAYQSVKSIVANGGQNLVCRISCQCFQSPDIPYRNACNLSSPSQVLLQALFIIDSGTDNLNAVGVVTDSEDEFG